MSWLGIVILLVCGALGLLAGEWKRFTDDPETKKYIEREKKKREEEWRKKDE